MAAATAVQKEDPAITKAKAIVCEQLTSAAGDIDMEYLYHHLRIAEDEKGNLTSTMTPFTPMTSPEESLGVDTSIDADVIIIAEYKKHGADKVFRAISYLKENEEGNLVPAN
jgi:hypothetical protein